MKMKLFYIILSEFLWELFLRILTPTQLLIITVK